MASQEHEKLLETFAEPTFMYGPNLGFRAPFSCQEMKESLLKSKPGKNELIIKAPTGVKVCLLSELSPALYKKMGESLLLANLSWELALHYATRSDPQVIEIPEGVTIVEPIRITRVRK